MIKILIRKYIPGWQDTKDPAVRTRYAMLAGILGILCNLILFFLKLVIGTAMNSIAITSDAFNNLSDLGSSLISAVSAKLAGQRPDNEHPFGHGRLEYIASLIVSFLIMMVGVELLRSSFDKILHPEILNFQWIPLLILMISVLIKVWMWSYNRYMGQAISSTILSAAAADSANDVMSTSAVILATIVGQFTPAWLPIDGIVGLAVSLLILKAGFGIAKETVGLLLGSAPDAETVHALESIIMSGADIIGVHDLMIHDYGPGRTFASVHAEVPDTANIIRVHENIDALEQRIMTELGITAVIHMDPVTVGNEKADHIREIVTGIITTVNPRYTLHDFHITDGESRINVIFDLVVPLDEKPEITTVHTASIRTAIKQADERYTAVIKIDHGIVS